MGIGLTSLANDSIIARSFSEIFFVSGGQFATVAKRDIAEKDPGRPTPVALIANADNCKWTLLKGGFFRIYGGNSFETKKPDPLGVRTLLKEFNVRAEEAVMIGDSDVDMETAKNAGIWSVGVTYGLSPETLVDTPGDVMVDAAKEWLEVF